MNNQLQSYISENLAKDASKETIRSNLLSTGWTKEQIDPVLYPQSEQKDIPTPTSSAVMGSVPSLYVSSWLLRIGLAFVFLYAAASLSLNPSEGEHFLPTFVTMLMPAKLFLSLFGIYEIILSLWLLSGKWTKYSGLLAALTIFGITSLNLTDFSVLFRNVAIFFASLALAFLPPSQKRK